MVKRAKGIDAAERAIMAPPRRVPRKPARDAKAQAWAEIHVAAGKRRKARAGCVDMTTYPTSAEARPCAHCGGTGVARPKEGAPAVDEPVKPESFFPLCVRDGCPWRVEVQLFLAELGPEEREREIRSAAATAVCADHLRRDERDLQRALTGGDLARLRIAVAERHAETGGGGRDSYR